MVSAWLAAQHAKHQETLANNLVVGLYPLWRVMRFDALDASTPLWLEAVLPRVETAFLQSQRLSAVFNANVRAAELPTSVPLVLDVPQVQFPADLFPRWPFELPPLEDAGGRPQVSVPAPEFRRAEVAQSLTIEANYNTKRAMPGKEAELMQDALVRSSGAAVRQALNGGRGVTDQVMRRDRKVIGFARVTDSDPCALCALLSSRGTVYGKGSFLGTDKKWKVNEDAARDVPPGWSNVAKVHNNCRCMLRPVYANEARWDSAAKHFLQVWNDRKVLPGDVEAVLKHNPSLKGYDLVRAVDWRAYRRDLKANPFRGNQFDMNLMRRDLRERADGLLNAGFAPNSPNVRWAERASGFVA